MGSNVKKIKVTKTEAAAEHPGEKILEKAEVFFGSPPEKEQDGKKIKIEYLERELSSLTQNNDYMVKLNLAQKNQLKAYQMKIYEKLQNIDVNS